MKKLTLSDLDHLAVGSTILGSGGGGDSSYLHMMAQYAIDKHGPVSLTSIDKVDRDAIVLPIGGIGAPLIDKERFQTGEEFRVVIEVLENALKKKIKFIIPFEIGGENAFVPLIVAAKLNLPIVDGDMMGRAFPEVQMSSCSLMGMSPSPGAISDSLNNVTLIYPKDSKKLEKIGRHITIAMGSSAYFGLFPMAGKEIQKCAIPETISKALSIGETHQKAVLNQQDPLKSILQLCKGSYIGSGKIVDVDQIIAGGFSHGKVIIEDANKKLELIFQNEYLITKHDNNIIATTPDILVLLEQDTGKPVTSETLQFGIRVNLIALPSHPIWTTPEGLALVGPRYFGYNVDYKPISI